MRSLASCVNFVSHRQRLVILGEPGMGKTTLAVLILGELLRIRPESPRNNGAEESGPVPVFLSLSDWNVNAESLDAWLERRLVANFPSLQAAEFGPTAPRDIARSENILPILDGLDELSGVMRARALEVLSTASTRPLIVTSRTDEYIKAVRAQTDACLGLPQS